MSKLLCCKCSAIATWYYMPDSTNPNRAYCDDCVPRGCSCNSVPKDDNWDSEDPDNWEQELDEQGRELPCCEYWYEPNGWDE